MFHPALRRAAPFAALLLYCALAFYQLDLPGFYYDEALDLPAAVQMAHGQPPVLSPRDPGLPVGGVTLPVMILDYLGAANTYLLLPVLALMGSSWLSVRWFEVATGAVVIALGHRLGRRWFGPAVAGVTALLVAVNPSFLFWTRQGISVTALMSLCALGSLLALDGWSRTQRLRWLGLAGFLLGFGLWAKLLFLWWLAALALVYAIVEWRRWRPSRAALERGEVLGLPWTGWAWGAAGFAVGAAPLIYYNLRTGRTLEVVRQSLNAPTDYGVNNARVLENLRAALEQFRIFLDGSYFWYNGAQHASPWAVPVYIVSAALAIGLLWRWPAHTRRRFAATALIVAAFVVQSAFTVSGIWATHLYLLVPFLQFIPALAAVGLWRRAHPLALSPGWILRLAAAALALALFAGDLSVSVQYHRTLAQTGGVGRFSDAIYRLADYLDRNSLWEPAALDWGLEKNVLVLTDGRVQPVEIFGYSPEPDAGFRERVIASLCDECAFIANDARHSVYPRVAAFRQIVAETHWEIYAEEPLLDRAGQPAYWVYRVRAVVQPAP